MRIVSLLVLLIIVGFTGKKEEPKAWIRINLLGYPTTGKKIAVYAAKNKNEIREFYLVDASNRTIVYEGKPGKAFGAYGPFLQTYRLDFSSFKRKGSYYLITDNAQSPTFTIGDSVYKGAADFCLRYMRQQRSGFNPFLKDSCHTQDGYTLYGEKAGLPDSTHIDVSGGWHDASDYLQYSSTSANATYHLLMAYRDFPTVFKDEKLANGLDGKNNCADVLDEAKWGLDWLLKMHPKNEWMFNQLADDRDHMGMRIPKEDSFYGKGIERPVYFVTGEPQQRGKFMNNSSGTASTAGKFSSAFALGSNVFRKENPPGRTKGPDYSDTLYNRASSAFQYGYRVPGVSQTASVRSPYIYAEDNWTDDMELAAVALHNATDPHSRNSRELDYADSLSRIETITPWLGADTAKHYQWYPFINIGHYELAKSSRGKQKEKIVEYYKEGIKRVWEKAKANAFYRGVPFIWCSNNLTVSFAIQCYWYRQLTGKNDFEELEQANFDWLLGCNPWGTSMIYGLPENGDTPIDPHSAFTHLKNYPVDGGLVDGPVYTSIYKNLIGIKLYQPDEYVEFQSDLAVYHDDYGDYSTNEPTMDGTASLIYLLAAKEKETTGFAWNRGAIIRGDSTKQKLALVFTGDEFADGGITIANALKEQNVKASFFLTGRFYRNKSFETVIRRLKKDGHYLGAHSDQHLLYCDWNKRDSLLVTKKEFQTDLLKNYSELKRFGVTKEKAGFFLPPYEWYNDSIAVWTKEMDLQLINFTPGTRSTADYTWPELKNYQSTEQIFETILDRDNLNPSGLNGYLLLLHIGTDPRRTDKFYNVLPELLRVLMRYELCTVDELLKNP